MPHTKGSQSPIYAQRQAIYRKRRRELKTLPLLNEQKSISLGIFARYAEKYVRETFDTDNRLVVFDPTDGEPMAVVLSASEYEVLCAMERGAAAQRPRPSKET